MFRLSSARRLPSSGVTPALAGEPAGRDGWLLSEPMFLHALCLERKRAERSGHFFVLMLVDLGRLQPHGHGAELNAIVAAILSSVRETDISGWHVADQVLGVIFTEVGASDRTLTLAALRTRMTAALQSVPSSEDRRPLQLSFHVFPDAACEPSAGRPAIRALYPDLVRRDASRRVSHAVKRSFDAAASLVALIVLAPLLLAIGIAITLSSRGPVLFRQERIGQYGVPFTFLKFRSMHASNDAQLHRAFVTRFIRGDLPPAGASHGTPPVYKITTDPRVTRVGALLRRTSLDELPQLLNVLRGEMSLVGPRPPIPYELEAYDVWHRRRLLGVKPGITGLWQVSGRSRLRFDDMVRLDLKYADAWSFWLDLRILLRTPRAVLSGEGAY
jgi:lipopolysaccharide/colanic/teichoic acid biosynthesis glycosyltransferase